MAITFERNATIETLIAEEDYDEDEVNFYVYEKGTGFYYQLPKLKRDENEFTVPVWRVKE